MRFTKFEGHRDFGELVLLDIGDAMEQTRQVAPYPAVPDSTFGEGAIRGFVEGDL